MGKQARSRRPRKSIGAWQAPAGRDDPIAVLIRQDETRVPELLPIRYARMVASPFAFYRGAAAIMAADLACSPSSGLTVQLCGDAHLANLGGFAAPDRRLVFDLNDFDETLRGPFEWDVLRLVASFEVAARGSAMRFDDRRLAVMRAAGTYRREMHRLAAMTELDVWNQRVDVKGMTRLVGPEFRHEMATNLKRRVKEAHRKDRFRALARLTEVRDGERRFVHDPPLLVPAEELFDDVTTDQLHESLRRLLESYRETLAYPYRCLLDRYELRHVARKVVGVGSVGSRAWVALLEGRDQADPLFLQVKQAGRSVLEEHLGPSPFENHGERVVAGQSLMQSATDPFLGWDRAIGPDGITRDYYVRQLWDWKGSADIGSMTPRLLVAYGEICGSVLARAHARSGDRIAIASYLGRSDVFDHAVARFAVAYADQNDRDHSALESAITTGRLTAQPDT